jgi:hypothetical protein
MPPADGAADEERGTSGKTEEDDSSGGSMSEEDVGSMTVMSEEELRSVGNASEESAGSGFTGAVEEESSEQATNAAATTRGKMNFVFMGTSRFQVLLFVKVSYFHGARTRRR